jgi:hypothetical protein
MVDNLGVGYSEARFCKDAQLRRKGIGQVEKLPMPRNLTNICQAHFYPPRYPAHPFCKTIGDPSFEGGVRAKRKLTSLEIQWLFRE